MYLKNFTKFANIENSFYLCRQSCSNMEINYENLGYGAFATHPGEVLKDEMMELVAICDRFKTLKHSTTTAYAFTEFGVSNVLSSLISKQILAYYNYYFSCEDIHIGLQALNDVFRTSLYDRDANTILRFILLEFSQNFFYLMGVIGKG